MTGRDPAAPSEAGVGVRVSRAGRRDSAAEKHSGGDVSRGNPEPAGK